MLPERTCTIPGCGKPRKIRYEGPRLERWCSMHYERFRKYGTTDPRPKRLCSVPGCGKPHHARGYCPMHLFRWKRDGDPGPAESTRIPLTSGPEMRSTRGDEEKLRKVWRQMHARCKSPKDKRYDRYGGRGIRVCEEWSSYEPFRAWALANGYQDGLTIDRRNNDGHYEPANCRWATRAEQALNRSRNRRLTAFGETKTAKEWAEDPRCVVSYVALLIRIDRKDWPVEQALTAPSRSIVAKPPGPRPPRLGGRRRVRPELLPTHCPQGHPYSPENTYVDKNGWRKCATCVKANVRRWQQRQRDQR